MPFFWMLAVPAIFVGILLVRMLFWLRSLSRPLQRRPEQNSRPFIEGEFVDEEDPDKRSNDSKR